MDAIPFRGDPVDGAARPHLAMPLGGIGTGNLAIGADGALRQWQLHNIGNHVGALPFSFFSVRAIRGEPPLSEVRILQARTPAHDATPHVNDDFIPPWHETAYSSFPPVESSQFQATYPFASVSFTDPGLPLDIEMLAYTPLTPFDLDDSAIPAALFEFRVRNIDEIAIQGQLGASLLNAVGWDGMAPFDGTAAAGMGGNTNRLLRESGWTSLVLENSSLDPAHAGAGQMVLAGDHADASALVQWQTVDEYRAFFDSRAVSDAHERIEADPQMPQALRHSFGGHLGPSAPGTTWATGMLIPFSLEPGAETTIRFLITWRFPNRYVNFEQPGPAKPEWGPTRFWLGNAYANRFADAQAVARHVIAEWNVLRTTSASWARMFTESSLDDQHVQHLAAQPSLVRSPTCFRTADGRFYGFEGVLGASTTMWNGMFGGSCPLNCTHVWNYAQVTAKVFPALERSMREIEFEVMQAPQGYLPHRVIVPLYLPQLWDQAVGGPELPALDGMLGAVLKTYREYRNGAGIEWLERYWPNLVRLLTWVRDEWDADGDGVLIGVQPSTHDIDLRGVNPYMGGLWLAALLAAERCGREVGDDARADEYRSLFEKGTAAYDAALFNGEYYEQRLEPEDDRTFQWETGCLSDQLIGQWWAHELGLGYILPRDHVVTALSSIAKHNFRESFADFSHDERALADAGDSGLLMCSWPRGGRPEVPVRYADEVWTGVEYQVAAHCHREGLEELGLRIAAGVWDRYDGRRRNPFNEIECGDHYARAMAGWSVLEAVSGLLFDSESRAMSVRSPGDRAVAWPILTDTAWGLLRIDGDAVSLDCLGGSFDLAHLAVGTAVATPVAVASGCRVEWRLSG